jgi:hypothetical protein
LVIVARDTIEVGDGLQHGAHARARHISSARLHAVGR